MNASKCIRNVKVNFSMLRQRKFGSTFRTFDKSTLNRRWTARTSKDSAIGYVKGKAALWAMHYMLWLQAHLMSLSLNQLLIEILKTFSRSVEIIGVKRLLAALKQLTLYF